MSLPLIPVRTTVTCACLAVLLAQPVAAQPSRPSVAAPRNELDAFMEKVLAQRDVNRQMLRQYILDEVEAFEILGPSRTPLHRMKREFTWYVRDGMHVRSPVRFDGVAVGESARRQYEEDWIRRERERIERRKQRGQRGSPSSQPSSQQDAENERTPIATPRFVSEAYFMDFKFEAGNYYLAGREQLEGKEVLRIEYYPEHLFSDDDEHDKAEEQQQERKKPGRDEGSSREQKMEHEIERKINKTALVTLWVDPTEHQIVKYTFDNIWMDFLPGAWLVRVDDIRASMTMGQPFPGIWLPRGMNIHAGVSLANGSFEAGYTRTFSDYREADVKTRIRVPKVQGSGLDVQGSGLRGSGLVVRGSGLVAREKIYFVASGFSRKINAHAQLPPDQPPPRLRRSAEARLIHMREGGGSELVVQSSAFVVQSFDDLQHPSEVIGEIRVHGNASLRDDEVIQLAGLAVGQRLEADAVAAVERRLKESGRFESVEVRKRYRSLTSTTDVAIVLVVHERPGVTSVVATNPVSGPFHRVTSRLMFLPILSYADGYGFTYGGRVSTLDLLGIGERLSVPLTWGGTKRAALEFERTFKAGPLTRVESSFGIWNRQNPHFRIDDQRVEWKARAERQFIGLVRTGVDASRSSVDFGTIEDRIWTIGADVTLDTRGDPSFPRNAVVLGAGWSGLHVNGSTSRINRYTADARGYVGLIGQSVVAARMRYLAADAPLPPYERLLLGGSSTLRGFRTGTFDGDRMVTTSAELRVPITSVISGARLGLTAFVDAAKAYDQGIRFADAEWHQGAGAGVFLIASVVRINLDVAHGFKHGDTRLHLSSGFGF